MLVLFFYLYISLLTYLIRLRIAKVKGLLANTTAATAAAPPKGWWQSAGSVPGTYTVKVGGVFNAVVAVGGESHQIAAAALHLHHIASGLFTTDPFCVITPTTSVSLLDQADGAVFQFSRRVGL